MGLPGDIKAFRSWQTEAGSGDHRACYAQVFHPADECGGVWNGILSLDTHTLVQCEYTGSDLRWISMEDDTKLDAADPQWEQMARQFVNGARADPWHRWGRYRGGSAFQ
ncbi:MAG: hypothetical protein IJ189_05855 [Clostridia bacterium]|nr:hypothetical protein [Clostridia bacterium]